MDNLGIIVALLCSIEACSTDLKWTWTPHMISEEISFTTHWSGRRLQVWVQGWVSAIWQSFLKAVPEGTGKQTFWTSKSMAKPHMIEFSFPNYRALLPIFLINCSDGSHFAQMPGIPPTPVLFGNMYVHKTPPTPPQNTPHWAKCLKSGQNFSRSKQFFVFISPTARAAGSDWAQLWQVRLASTNTVWFSAGHEP